MIHCLYIKILIWYGFCWWPTMSLACKADWRRELDGICLSKLDRNPHSSPSTPHSFRKRKMAGFDWHERQGCGRSLRTLLRTKNGQIPDLSYVSGARCFGVGLHAACGRTTKHRTGHPPVEIRHQGMIVSGSGFFLWAGKRGADAPATMVLGNHEIHENGVVRRWQRHLPAACQRRCYCSANALIV